MDGAFCHNCREAQQFCLCIDDPLLDVRYAIAAALKTHNVIGDHKAITDAAIANMPGYWRVPVQNCRAQVRTNITSKHD